MSMSIGQRLVGREQELQQLRGLLKRTFCGAGSLVLVSGEAGVGKTSLVRELAANSRENNWLVLTGHCYDLSAVSPYGPWREVVEAAMRQEQVSAAASSLRSRDSFVETADAETLFSELAAYLTEIAAQQPLVITLEDLHWSDPGSIEFLRAFARGISALPILLIVTYRETDLTPDDPLYPLLPQLVREAGAHRIHLLPLDRSDIETLVQSRYELSTTDEDRLVSYLEWWGHGIPLYLIELLQTLEDEGGLLQSDCHWELQSLDQLHVPLLIRQLIHGRVTQLEPSTRNVVEIAAVIGHDVPLWLWRRVSEATNDLFAEAFDYVMRANILEESLGSMALKFHHALVREAIYAGIPLLQRQEWHRQVAEALDESGSVEPETIAYHFQQAGDPKAVEWFIRAGRQFERVAWATAADCLGSASELMDEYGGELEDRIWLLIRRAQLMRLANPRLSLAILEEAAVMAEAANDELLRAYVRLHYGHIRGLVGELRLGLEDLQAGVTVLDAHDAERSDYHKPSAPGAVATIWLDVDTQIVAISAVVGRVAEALAHAQAVIDRTGEEYPGAAWARGMALALAGEPLKANDAFALTLDLLRNASDYPNLVTILLIQLESVQLPYFADDLLERRRIADEAESAWKRSGLALGNLSPRLARLNLLYIEGSWTEARELARTVVDSEGERTIVHVASIIVQAQMSAAQGKTEEAWEAIQEFLPDGVQSMPGDENFTDAQTMQVLSASLCLDVGDFEGARAWTEAHARWLGWSGAVLGKASGQLLWARLFQAEYDIPRARHHARQAVEFASDPRQPLTLLTALRTLGQIECMDAQYESARAHLQEALALSTACMAPYERALTLVALAKLEQEGGDREQAHAFLDEAREISVGLGAAPSLARIDRVRASLTASGPEDTAPVGADLSPREIDVLCLVAAGQSNREIAVDLKISTRTAERHITNIYNKLGISSRAEAIAFAHRHQIV